MTNITLYERIHSFEPSPNAPILEPFKHREFRGRLIQIEKILVEEMQRPEILHELSGTFHLKVELTQRGGVVNHKMVDPGLVFEYVGEIDVKSSIRRMTSDTPAPYGGWVPTWSYEHLIYCPESIPPEIIGIGTITISDE